METAITMERPKDMTDKNLINSAGIAIYKMMKSDSGINNFFNNLLTKIISGNRTIKLLKIREMKGEGISHYWFSLSGIFFISGLRRICISVVMHFFSYFYF